MQWGEKKKADLLFPEQDVDILELLKVLEYSNLPRNTHCCHRNLARGAITLSA